jgi:hypothetical protein
MAAESKLEREIIEELELLFPDCIILKNYGNFMQGFPDRLILYQDRWAAFEVKAFKTAPHRPNQDYYIRLLNGMSFAAFVYPQNKEVFLDEIQRALRPDRRARILKRK